jgi:F420-0:gamma-glutamyl ligase
LAVEKVLDSIAIPAIAIRGSSFSFEEQLRKQIINREATMFFRKFIPRIL